MSLPEIALGNGVRLEDVVALPVMAIIADMEFITGGAYMIQIYTTPNIVF